MGRNLRMILALAMAASWLCAPDPNLSIGQYGHQKWTRQDDGLPGAVSALTQTADGRLWVGTEFGLFNFDGVTFSRCKSSSGVEVLREYITALKPALDGGLWI